jgi:hypothetical protein
MGRCMEFISCLESVCLEVRKSQMTEHQRKFDRRDPAVTTSMRVFFSASEVAIGFATTVQRVTLSTTQ